MTGAAFAALFWGALGALAYGYALYPLLVLLFARMARSPAAIAEPAEWPAVSVLVAAYNEEAHIAARIENLLAQDYPVDRLTVLVGSDGSTDVTAAIASRYAGERVRVHAFPMNRGKASVMNDLVAASETAILVLTDANTEFRPDAVRALVRHLVAGAGVACGELVLTRAAAGGNNADHAYWSFERRLKRAEAALGGLVGANGAIYAMRRELYRPLPADMICDDLVIAMDAAAGGARLDYVPAALAFEEAPADLQAEVGRRIRIGIGNYQAFFRRPSYLASPWPMPWTYVSHKALRWFTPHLLAAVFVASWALAARPGFLAFAIAQSAGYAFAAIAYAAGWRLPRLARLPLMGLVLNAAFAIAFVRYLRGQYRGSWARTERKPDLERQAR